MPDKLTVFRVGDGRKKFTLLINKTVGIEVVCIGTLRGRFKVMEKEY